MPATIRPRRSVLYVPGSNARAIEKARTLAADAVILDLEDAVSPEKKATARALVAQSIGAANFGRREVVVRINGLDTGLAASDIAATVPRVPDAILVPKISRSDDVRRVRGALQAAGAKPGTAIWAMIETPLAVLNAGAIAATALEEGPALTMLVLGTNDLTADARLRPTSGRGPLLPWIATTVAAARSFDLSVVDGVFNDFSDVESFRAECEQGRDFGMDGKTLIHPDQIAIANEVFAPSPDEVAWAQTIIAAFRRPDSKDRGAIAIDGRMVERLHEVAAQRTLEIAKAIASGA